jgi:predicted nucleic-acid-binding protein
MIGIDSNILLRAIANDDATQSPLARDFLSSLSASGPGVVNSVVLAEVSWALRKRYKEPLSTVLAVVSQLLESDAYVIPDRDAVIRAVEACRNSGLEFAHALIGELNLIAGARSTATFDGQASKAPAFEKLSIGKH